MGVVDTEQLSGLCVSPFPALDNVDVEDATVARTVHRHSDSDGHVCSGRASPVNEGTRIGQ